MLDYAFDAPTILEHQGTKDQMPLSLAITVVTSLLAKDLVFTLKDETDNMYCTFDGETFYGDSRITSVISATGHAMKEV